MGVQNEKYMGRKGGRGRSDKVPNDSAKDRGKKNAFKMYSGV